MNSINSIFPWCEAIWKTLFLSIQKKRLPHAILFYGNEGLGKSTTALQLAQFLLCSNPTKNTYPCQICKDCLLFSAQTHGDFYNLSPEENSKNIGIDQIRNLKVAAYQKPQRNCMKVFVIARADNMTVAASNALLKVLEEPPGDSIFILTTDKKHLLPSTILSRCHQYRFFASIPEKAEQWLLSNSGPGLTKEMVKESLTWSLGSPLLAQKLLKKNLVTEYQSCVEPLLDFFSEKKSSFILTKAWQGKSLENLIYASQIACYHLLKGTWPGYFNKKLVYQWSRKILNLKKMMSSGIALNETLMLDFLLSQ